MTDWEITVQPQGYSTKVVRDGVNISNEIRNIEIHTGINGPTTIALEYLAEDDNIIVKGETG